MKKELELRYVAHVTTLTSTLVESHQTTASSIRELVAELDTRYDGFQALFVDSEGESLKLNAMIYYSDAGEIPVSVINLDHPIRDGATVTFW
jgi:hypothetical protein